MIGRIWIAVAAFLAAAWPLSAQNGTYNGFSPYSVYGIGDLHAAGTAFNASMGGVGIATRNKRFVNTMNPASITARDSLSFMPCPSWRISAFPASSPCSAKAI